MRKEIVLLVIAGGIGLAIGLGFLSFPAVDDGANEFIVQPTPPWATTDCDRLQALIEEGTFGTACLEEVGMEEYDNRRQMWLDLITEQNLSADEAIAGFYAWLSSQGENCRIRANIMLSWASCPQPTPSPQS